MQKTPPPPSLDQARFIFTWLALLSRCPCYLRALHRLVYNALMYLKKHTRMHCIIAFVKTHPNLVFLWH